MFDSQILLFFGYVLIQGITFNTDKEAGGTGGESQEYREQQESTARLTR